MSRHTQDKKKKPSGIINDVSPSVSYTAQRMTILTIDLFILIIVTGLPVPLIKALSKVYKVIYINTLYKVA